MFEPVHGSAPDIAGTGAANPLATFLSAAMLLRDGLGMGAEAARIEAAVEAVLARGLRTPIWPPARPSCRRSPSCRPRSRSAPRR